MRFSVALDLDEMATPAAPAAGSVRVYAKTGGTLWVRNSAGVERPLEPGVVFPFSRAGTLVASVGTHRLYNDTGSDLTIKAVRASVGAAPSGSSIIVDVNVNGSTIFSTQPNRPAILAGNFTSGKVVAMNTVTIADGAYFSIDIDQVGSTVAGADLTVQILC